MDRLLILPVSLVICVFLLSDTANGLIDGLRRMLGYRRRCLLYPWPCRTVLVEHVDGPQHGNGKVVGIIFTAEVEAVDCAVVAPLVERARCLAVLEALEDGTVYHHLMVVQLPAHDAEGAVDRVLVDVHLGEAARRATGHPLLVVVIVH